VCKDSTAVDPSFSLLTQVGPAADAPRTDGKDSVGPGIYGMWVEFGLKKKRDILHSPTCAQHWMRPR
jgi:hypothetical protein